MPTKHQIPSCSPHKAWVDESPDDFEFFENLVMDPAWTELVIIWLLELRIWCFITLQDVFSKI